MYTTVTHDRIVELHPVGLRSLNVRELLNQIFFTPTRNHPDASRQRKARQLAKDRREARRLKGQYVPLYFVDPTIYLQEYDYYDCTCRRWMPTGRAPKKDVQTVYMPTPRGNWRRYELSA